MATLNVECAPCLGGLLRMLFPTTSGAAAYRVANGWACYVVARMRTPRASRREATASLLASTSKARINVRVMATPVSLFLTWCVPRLEGRSRIGRATLR